MRALTSSRISARTSPAARRTSASAALRKFLAEARQARQQHRDVRVWSKNTAKGNEPATPGVRGLQHDHSRGRTAVRRYRSGIVPKPVPPGLAPKTVRNVHALLHRALVDAVAGIPHDNPSAMSSHAATATAGSVELGQRHHVHSQDVVTRAGRRQAARPGRPSPAPGDVAEKGSTPRVAAR